MFILFSDIMNIKILHLLEGAKQAKGLTVIIDVFRAFSVASFVLANGAERIIPIGDLSLAYKLKEENPDFILIGEREGKPQKGFEYGNSPFEIKNVNFKGKTVIQTTSSGTQGIANAKNADEIIAGNFTTANAIITCIKKKNPEQVSLVGMGHSLKTIAAEDLACAKYIKNALEKNESYNNIKKIKEKLKEDPTYKRFVDPNITWVPEEDFELCLDINRFNFIIKAELYKEGLVQLKKCIV